MTKQAKPSFENLKAELDEIMLALQQDSLDVDKAIEYYERGLKLVKELESYLENAENKVKQLKAKFNSQT